MRHTLLFAAITLCLTAHAQKNFYPGAWSDVYKYEVKDLPKSALKVVDSIYLKAKKDGNVTEITKALLYQSKFALTLKEDAEPEVINKFEREIKTSKAPLRNILESMLAQIYWQHFQANRWKYYDRSRTADSVYAEDFRLWDATKMTTEIDRHFTRSLANVPLLQATPLEKFDDILALAENSKRYRPTLYDFLANNALDFYMTNENSVVVADTTATDSEYYPEDSISDANESDQYYRTLKLLKDLIQFHEQRRDTNAYVNAALERWRFLEAHAYEYEDFDSKAMLEALRSRVSNHPASALVDVEIAKMLLPTESDVRRNRSAKSDKKRALQICNDALARFPGSDGAQRCASIKEHILSKTLALESEKFVPVSKASLLRVQYRNITQLNLNIYKIQDELEQRFNAYTYDSLKIAILLSLQAQQSWQSTLIDKGDYEQHTTQLAIPALSKGKYLIVASEKTLTPGSDNIFGYAFIGVTDIALLQYTDESNYRYQVVNRNNGEPVAGAVVHVHSTHTRDNGEVVDERLTSDRNGFVNLGKQPEGSWSLSADVMFEGDTVQFNGYYYYRYRNNHKNQDDNILARTFLFTDRSIYRPGQTVFFKGMLIKTKNDKSSVVAGEYVEVILEDVNGTEVGAKRIKTNSFGSFSGEFKLPNNGLTGEFTLYADEDVEEDSKFWEDDDLDFEYDELTISVEEYKRPTFEVLFKALTGTYKLNDSITVNGEAASFSASKLSKAKVSYTVKRDISYSYWSDWSMNNDDASGEVIAQGTTVTNDKGEFHVRFKAIPDETPATQRPIYIFSITADVTDINGETRSRTEKVRVGYHAMVANINAAAQIDLQQGSSSLTVKSENLNGQYLPATGSIKIFKLEAPEFPVRQRLWSAPDVPVLSREEFRQLFPHDLYADETGVSSNWKKGTLVRELKFDTQQSKDVSYSTDKSWEIGAYVMELETRDSTGQLVTDNHQFSVVNSAGNQVPDNSLFVFHTDKSVYKAGEVAKVTIGSAAKDVVFTLEVEKNNKIVRTFIEQLNGNTKELRIPITTVQEGAITVHCSAVVYNSILQQHQTLMVQTDREKFEIETETFTDKLQPGSKQTWSFIINGEEGKKLEAEVLASMYDASLDQFQPHAWEFNPVSQPYYYSRHGINGYQSFGVTDFDIRNATFQPLNIAPINYDAFDWFGFNLGDQENAKRRYMQRLYYASSTGKPSKVSMSYDKTGREGFVFGRLTDSEGHALPGVNVIVKGTTRGTATDMNGNFSIEAGRNDVLVFSFIGYMTTEVKPGKKNVVNVAMNEDVTQLSEVVVVGYGTQQRKDLTGATAYVVSSLEAPSEVIFEEVLQGRAAGVQLAAPGAAYHIRIRGNASLDDSDKVLYVVDGVPVEKSTINESDLQSIQVLKGSAATALYGARAANGVIVITTKSGQKKLDEEMAKVNARKNFNETAFFHPHLTTDESGRIRFSFTTPESLTRWKIQLLAHTRDLLTTRKTLQAVTQKQLMVTPNVPRFLRIGDEVIISAKVANLTDKKLDGKIALQLNNAVNGEAADQQFENLLKNQTFKVAARGTTEVSWKLKVPSTIEALQYRIVAKAGTHSDGEQNILPVLSNRILVTESIPMTVRANQTKTFTLGKLLQQSSQTLQHHQLSLELTSNPAWYAIQSLPYLMEFPHECAEQTFARYYANTIASHILNSKPIIKEVFDKWAASGELKSDLEKNQELKSVIIEETPWLRDAQSETEKKKRIALLFDLNTISNQASATTNKLEELQFANGGFPWFAGNHDANRYITQHIASGFGHLRHLKIKTDDRMKQMFTKAVRFLDAEVQHDYKKLLDAAEAYSKDAKTGDKVKLAEQHIDGHIPSALHVQYLYMRSFYQEISADEKAMKAIAYFEKQTASKWRDYKLYLKGMIALIQYRAGNKKLAYEIMRSLKENAIVSEELGMYWKENAGGWYWHEAPVETQALLIEAFAEIDDPEIAQPEKDNTIDELRMWLLKNKQTNSWQTTKATTEAAYALLLTGNDWLSLDNAVSVSVGSKPVSVDMKDPEAGTGYFKTSWQREAVTPAMGSVTISKKGNGIAWGGLYWQYFEDLDKITSAETPLKLSKKIFKVLNTNNGEVITPVETETLKPGDLVRIKIELKADRDMEFLHMKDMRAAGFEPVEVLSQYKWQEGLGYYQSTRDASTNFFFDFIAKGVYVFEYDLRVNSKGNFSNGITTIQSMYAPQFGSHSEGVRVRVE